MYICSEFLFSRATYIWICIILKTRKQFYDIWYTNSEQKFWLWSSQSCYCVTTQKSVHTRVYFSFHIMCQWDSGSHCFQGLWCLTLEDDGTTNPWNIGNHNTVSHPVRLESSVTSPWQPDISQALNLFMNEFTFPDVMKYCHTPSYWQSGLVSEHTA